MKIVRNRLFVMMVLEFFVWGAWLPLVWPYMADLGFSSIRSRWWAAPSPSRRWWPSSSATSSPTATSPPKRFLGFPI
jgi:hypothetical protein